jgi:RNA polymerase sigma factor (sigma-70 family)
MPFPAADWRTSGVSGGIRRETSSVTEMAQTVGRPAGAPENAGRAKDEEFFVLMGELRVFRAGLLSDYPSDRALARAAGVSPTTVGDWLRGRRFPQDIDRVLHVVRAVKQAAVTRGVPIPGGAAAGLLDEDEWRAAHQAEAQRRAGLVSEAVQYAQAVSVLPRPAGRLLDEVSDPFALEVHRPVQPENSPAELSALPAYMPREHDGELGAVVRAAMEGTSGMVVLVGGSSTGKTRACWEALQLLRGRPWRLWHPIDPTRPDAALRELTTVGPQSVVWLNEAQFYLNTPDSDLGERVAAGLRGLLRDPARAPVLVLATLWPQFWDRLTARPLGSADPHAQARELLSGRDIPVPATFTAAQLQSLGQVGDSRLAMAAAAAPDRHITQFLAGAPELLARYRNAPPAAAALINAAIDARRLGMGAGLPQAFLADAALGYLTSTEWELLGEGWLEQALAYTAAPCKGISGPLTRIHARPATFHAIGSGSQASDEQSASDKGSVAGMPLYRLADYLDQYGRQHRENLFPPATFWAAANSHASPSDQVALGNAAYCLGRYRYATQLRENAVAYISLDDPAAVAALLDKLRAAGADEQVSTLADRAAVSIPLDDPDAIAALLDSLRAAGADEQLTTLLCRDPAAHVSLADPLTVAALLDSLRAAGGDEQVSTLADRAAASIPLDDLDALARLLDRLQEAGAYEQVTVLAERAAAHIPLDDPLAVADLLDSLRAAGADEQVTVLINRDPAVHIPLDHPDAVAGLLDSLQAAGADEQVTALATRAAGQPRKRITPSASRAAGRFFRASYARLLAFALYMGATREEAEDAIESTMIDMLDRWEKIRNPQAYARKAVTRELIAQRKQSRRFIPLPDEGGEHLGGRDHDPPQEEKLTVWEDIQWVRGLLNSLPRRQQEVMALIVDEFRPAEIATLLGRDPAAVRQNLLAARRRLSTVRDSEQAVR